jgi:hypothetical protein
VIDNLISTCEYGNSFAYKDKYIYLLKGVSS